MKVAILSRSGPCFPNIISIGLSDMLNHLEIETKIFYDGIPLLMRLLPFKETPKHWYNNLQYRIRNKIKYYKQDQKLLQEIKQYDIVIVAECLPNALWKNFLAIEEFKKRVQKPVGSYFDGSVHIAPIHGRMLFDGEDYADDRYDFNLFVSSVIELKKKSYTPKQKVIGVNFQQAGLKPTAKERFIAVIDFEQKGYEAYRQQQINILKKLGIETIILEGRYPIEEIRSIYSKAAVFFMAFPETFGLPLAENLASGTYIFTPDSGWPMAWRLDDNPMPWGPGVLPDCFKVYSNEQDLEAQLLQMKEDYNGKKAPFDVFNTFIKHYSDFYYGSLKSLKAILDEL
ncbi:MULTISPECIES: glycosyltransferase [Niastella]|uniref:Glycosyltransferase n=1 Tax=Niastella soli TaxID=2821487 RepID=A0ABS3YQJ3_9BACT|nr:glycosyltransferase [Niastella soli]MBO9200148.1 glycosyltransferase [Niastella soli]